MVKVEVDDLELHPLAGSELLGRYVHAYCAQPVQLSAMLRFDLVWRRYVYMIGHTLTAQRQPSKE